MLLTPNVLARDFGTRSEIAREGVRVFCEALESAQPQAMDAWRGYFSKWAGLAIERVPRHLTKLARGYGLSECNADRSSGFLFALQTYYSLVVELVVGRLRRHETELLPGNPFSWHKVDTSQTVQQFVEHLRSQLAGYVVTASCPADAEADGGCDWFKRLYQDLFPRPLRHALGEYYTPDWLAAHVLDQVGYTGEPSHRLLDPACGSGTFLIMALRRRRKGVASGQWLVASKEGPEIRDQRAQPVDGEPLLSTIHKPLATPLPIVGFDINPLAVLTARANYLIAIAELWPDDICIEPPVYLCDSIHGVPALPCAAEPFDYIVGNPPWIAWDNLSTEDREATKPLWERYGLFSLSGNAARHGGGKKDLSMLMLYVAADRYLKSGGRLGMVITQTLFQTKGAGDGFRRFQLGDDGAPLGVLRVDDMTALRPFDDAANWTSTIVLQKGVATEYPVPYFVWGEERGAKDEGPEVRGQGSEEVASETNPKSQIPNQQIPNPCPGSNSPAPHFAQPIDATRPNSPWLISSTNHAQQNSTVAGPAEYTAHLGANSGGANGVYWLDVLEAANGGVRIRNVVARGKRDVEPVEQVIEPDLLYPLLRWSDVDCFAASPSGYILLAQDPATRSGIDEATMREHYPRTFTYLRQFRQLLEARAAYRRYQQQGPFYAMYNVGPYTTAPIKVVWRRMDRRIRAAVLEPTDNPLLGRRPIIPQETCVLVACDTSDEAHYLCALLNSARVNELAAACQVRGGKGFGTPGMLDFLPLRRFEATNPEHRKLAALGRRAHIAKSSAIQCEMDLLAAKII